MKDGRLRKRGEKRLERLILCLIRKSWVFDVWKFVMSFLLVCKFFFWENLGRMNFIFEELFKKEGIFLVSSCWQGKFQFSFFPRCLLRTSSYFFAIFFKDFKFSKSIIGSPIFCPPRVFFPIFRCATSFRRSLQGI